MAKLKAKTRKTVTKRFKFTKTGKVKCKRASTSHLNRKDRASTKHRKDRMTDIVGAFRKKVKKMVVN